MQIYKCDRCGHEFVKGEKIYETKTEIKKFCFIASTETETRELCKRCYEEFFDYCYELNKEKQ